jgi:hypothetical protein
LCLFPTGSGSTWSRSQTIGKLCRENPAFNGTLNDRSVGTRLDFTFVQARVSPLYSWNAESCDKSIKYESLRLRYHEQGSGPRAFHLGSHHFSALGPILCSHIPYRGRVAPRNEATLLLTISPTEQNLHLKVTSRAWRQFIAR